MKKLKTIWITAIMSMLALPAVAQLTLDECQQLARENYPLLQKYDLIKQTAAYSIENINKDYLPQLSLSGQGILSVGNYRLTGCAEKYAGKQWLQRNGERPV